MTGLKIQKKVDPFKICSQNCCKIKLKTSHKLSRNERQTKNKYKIQKFNNQYQVTFLQKKSAVIQHIPNIPSLTQQKKHTS
jgi:hypothetical protein